MVQEDAKRQAALDGADRKSCGSLCGLFQPVIRETAGGRITERAFVTAEGKKNKRQSHSGQCSVRRKCRRSCKAKKPAVAAGYRWIQHFAEDLNRHGLYFKGAKK